MVLWEEKVLPGPAQFLFLHSLALFLFDLHLEATIILTQSCLSELLCGRLWNKSSWLPPVAHPGLLFCFPKLKTMNERSLQRFFSLC
jgi:hypothetical protein